MASRRYLPKSLQKLVTDNPDKISSGWSEDDGWAGDGLWSHWIYLKKGWCYPEPGSHIIHEHLVKDVRQVFKQVNPCTCEDCVPTRGPGYRRMIARLGADNAETLRLQVLREQREALAEAHDTAQQQRNRESYKDYPTPKGKSKPRK